MQALQSSHAMQPGWIDRPHQVAAIGDLALESGDVLRDCQISYVVHRADGALNPVPGDKVVLALYAIGSTHHRLDFMIGNGLALDLSRYTVIVVDAIGNRLSSSPSNSVQQPGRLFPRFTIRDMVASQVLLLDQLGVGALHAVVGASMGGMQALHWAVSHAARVQRVVAMTPMARTRPWSVVVNEEARRSLAANIDAAEP